MPLLKGHEIVGARLVGRMAPAALVDPWRRVVSAVVKRGFAVEYRDLEAPRTGIFDGLRIVIDPDVGFEMQCFLLLHLFGHSVQWVAPSLAASVHELQYTSDRERFMRVLHDYEREAAGFGLTLLHEAGVTTLDQWYSDFVETDWRYVEGFYRSGSLPNWEDCAVGGCRLIAATPIPELKQKQVEVRFAF